MDHYRPDDDLSDRSKLVVIITISKYSPVKDSQQWHINQTISRPTDCRESAIDVGTLFV